MPQSTWRPQETVQKWVYDWATKAWRSEEVPVAFEAREPIEGPLRTIYHMLDLSRPAGQQRVVAKAQKPGIGLTVEHVRLGIQTQVACQALAAAFNARKVGRPVQFADTWLIQRQGAELAVEPYLEGDFDKHNDTEGGLHSDRHTPQAFSHFTHVHTNGRLLVVDLQGIGDVFTNPQVHTRTGQGFGVYNRGEAGVADFYRTHKCNDLCRVLGLPPGRFLPVPTAGLYAPDAFRPSDYLRPLDAVPGSATPTELAILGITMEQFNRAAELFRRTDGDGSNTLEYAEVYQMMLETKIDHCDREKLQWLFPQFERTGSVRFREFVCLWSQ